MTSTLMPAGTPPVRVFGEPHLRTDGDLIALSFAKDGSLWSIEEPGLLRHWTTIGRPLETHTLSDLEMLWAFSHGAQVAVSASDDLTLWDVASGQSLTSLPQDSWVTAVAVNADSAFLATGHDDGTIRYWDLSTHAAVHTFAHHKKPIAALAFHSDGKTLAAASEDRTISVWDVPSGKLLGVLKGHTDRIPALAWNPKDRTLVSAGWDTTARFWNLATLEADLILNYHATQVSTIAFSPDGRLLASADAQNVVRVWDVPGKKLAHQFTGPTTEVRSLAFSPDGATLAATGDRVIHLWNVVSGEPILGAEERGRVKPSVAVSPGGDILASNAGGKMCKVWDVQSRNIKHTLPGDGSVHQVAFSPRGDWLAAAAGSRVRVWKSDGTFHLDLDGPDDPINLIAFSPDGKTLAGGGYSSAPVWLWNVEDGEPKLIIPDPLDGCAPLALAFHPHGRHLAVAGVDWLATGGSNGALSVWNLDERAEIASLFDASTALAFHPNGRRLAATTLDRTIGLYDVISLDLQTELLGHDAAITSLAYSPSGDLLASGSDDKTLRLWNDAGEEVAVIEVDSKVTSLAFSPDGKSLFTAHANTTCAQYDVTPYLV